MGFRCVGDLDGLENVVKWFEESCKYCFRFVFFVKGFRVLGFRRDGVVC